MLAMACRSLTHNGVTHSVMVANVQHRPCDDRTTTQQTQESPFDPSHSWQQQTRGKPTTTGGLTFTSKSDQINIQRDQTVLHKDLLVYSTFKEESNAYSSYHSDVTLTMSTCCFFTSFSKLSNYYRATRQWKYIKFKNDDSINSATCKITSLARYINVRSLGGPACFAPLMT